MGSKETNRPLTLGAAAAAILASSWGCLVIGIATLLVQISPSIARSLTWWSPLGPLSGASGVGIFFWLISWIILHLTLRKREPPMVFITISAFSILALSLILLFPPFYGQFTANHS